MSDDLKITIKEITNSEREKVIESLKKASLFDTIYFGTSYDGYELLKLENGFFVKSHCTDNFLFISNKDILG
jgi:hypothetical protein